MPVPKAIEFYRPILALADGESASLSRKDVVEGIISFFSLEEADCAELVPSGGTTRVENRAYWAISHLRKAGLLQYPERGRVEITQSGRDFLESHPNAVPMSEIRSLIASKEEHPEHTPLEDLAPSEDSTPDEQMGKSFLDHQDRLADEILDNMKAVSPQSFERLVTRLLSTMGYGEIGREIGHSGDQGIDGILNQDILGLEKVYVQAKRHTTGQIGEPDIRTFSGSLVARGATKGVFITTSAFSPTAKQAARDISMGNQFIRLIDGNELARLMSIHGVGVVTEIVYEVKKLDANYFAEL